MKKMLTHTVFAQYSPANQLVHITPEGKTFHCENGWQGEIFRSEPVSDTSRFRYASLTKPLTADATLSLIRQGRLAMDTRLLDIFPELSPTKDKRIADITIEHLLKHSAGFDRLKSIDPIAQHKKKSWCPDDLNRLKTRRLDFTPGEGYAYANLGYCLLGAVIERVTNEPFRDYLDKTYQLKAKDIKFLDGPYLPDEVRYDFRNSAFYGEHYHRYIDFDSLSSSAGLSGNAKALASVYESILSHNTFNILAVQHYKACDTGLFFECFGMAFTPFSPKGSKVEFYVQPGNLEGAEALAVIDDRGGITIWLGSATSRNSKAQFIQFLSQLGEALGCSYDKDC